jgi:BMFP domain-containing protein YqiC
MQTDNKLFDDLSRLGTSVLGGLQGVKGEIDGAIKRQLERLLVDMDLVTREEFEAVRAMAQAAREENERLAARLAALEQQQAPITPAQDTASRGQ